MSPVFYMFTDRERVFDIIEAIMRRPHAPELVPHRRRGPGPARGLGAAGARLPRLHAARGCDEYDRMVMRNRIFKARTEGIGALHASTRRSSGASPGPVLRACGFEWDFRKKRPYSRLRPVRVRHPDRPRTATATTARWCASRRCARACGSSSSAWTTCRAGAYKSRPPAGHAAAQGAHDARHRDADQPFPGRELGAGDPAGRGARRASRPPRATTATTWSATAAPMSYRTRIRTPSFPHMQMLPLISRGLHDPRPDGHPGQHRLRAGRRGPLSGQETTPC